MSVQASVTSIDLRPPPAEVRSGGVVEEAHPPSPRPRNSQSSRCKHRAEHRGPPPDRMPPGCEILTAGSETSSETFPPSPRPANDASEQAFNRH